MKIFDPMKKLSCQVLCELAENEPSRRSIAWESTVFGKMFANLTNFSLKLANAQNQNQRLSFAGLFFANNNQ